jgi:DNA-binding PadR family transcriptional regulator
MATLKIELKRGTLELLLLHLLADEPTYGYELVSRLSRRSGGWFRIKEGTPCPVE